MSAVVDREYIARQHVIRQAILITLYEVRKSDPFGCSYDLVHALGHAPEELQFAFGYLAELGFVGRTSASCRITAQGINPVEQELSV